MAARERGKATVLRKEKGNSNDIVLCARCSKKAGEEGPDGEILEEDLEVRMVGRATPGGRMTRYYCENCRVSFKQQRPNVNVLLVKPEDDGNDIAKAR